MKPSEILKKGEVIIPSKYSQTDDLTVTSDNHITEREVIDLVSRAERQTQELGNKVMNATFHGNLKTNKRGEKDYNPIK